MSESSNPTYGEPLEARSNELNEPNGTPAERCTVGPGHPPPDQRWKKGGPSPNPHGRPRKQQSMLPDVRKAFEQAVNKKISVPRGDKKVLMTRVGIGFEQLLNQFAKVDRYAAGTSWNTPISWTSIFWPNTGNLSRRRSPPNYQAILEASLARRNGAGNLAPAPWVLAPPELLDDDLAEPEATPPSPSKAAAQPGPEPKLGKKQKEKEKSPNALGRRARGHPGLDERQPRWPLPGAR
jgi:hypothetical protein